MSLLNSLIPPPSRAATRERQADLGQTVKPRYEVKETPEAFGVTVYLPGVAQDGLDVTAEEGQVRILGRRSWTKPEGWTSLYRETSDAAYELVLGHDNAIDPDKIAAELRDGILRLSLPKHEARKPRKISVN